MASVKLRPTHWTESWKQENICESPVAIFGISQIIIIIIIIIFIIIIIIIIIFIIIIIIIVITTIIINNFFFVGIIQYFKILQIVFTTKKLIKAN